MGESDSEETECCTTRVGTWTLPLWVVISYIVSGLLLFGGAALVVSRYAQKDAEWRLQDGLVIANDSEILQAWVHPDSPALMKFYVFNVTNAEDFIKGADPILTEHGPYTYKMYSPRFDVNFYDNNTVSYFNNNTLWFDPAQSVGSESDILHHINIPVVAVVEMLRKFKPESVVEKEAFKDILRLVGNENLIQAHTAREIIFGYEDNMLKDPNDILSFIGERVETTVGPFHGFNNSDDGLFLVETGKTNFENYNAIQRWNRKTELSCWSDKYANMINGTDGSFLRPHVKRNESRYLYFPEMFRSAELTYEEDSTYKDIETYRFHFSDDILKNATLVPANRGFCLDECYDSGLLYVGGCAEKSKTLPIFLSLPHFYQGASQLVQAVGGMKPNKSLHDSFFHVEPTTGAVLVGQRRLQINVHVSKYDLVADMKQIPDVFFPYLWLSREAVVDEKIALKLHTALIFISIAAYSGYIVAAVGAFLLLFTFAKTCHRVRKAARAAGDEESLIPGSSTGVEA